MMFRIARVDVGHARVAAAIAATLFMSAPVAAAEAPVQVPAPVTNTDPATVVPGSKAVARRLTTIVADLEKTKRFYEALGFREDRRAEVSDAASLAVFGLDPGARLTFIRMTMDNTLSTGRIDGGTLGFAQVHNRPLRRLREATRGETLIGMPILVMTTDGIDALHARLQAIGAEILAPPFAAGGGLTSMILRDPDGMRMEISQPGKPSR
jgi:catechol 2,3-dioxygenase-like lactoylglutathione lyase family enzyme